MGCLRELDFPDILDAYVISPFAADVINNYLMETGLMQATQFLRAEPLRDL